ncbi:MAG: hypothetical protein Q4Q06_04935 [Bacteroidota bacterium]|nr:hypothetical protein [Bacteroidota bacterium]
MKKTDNKTTTTITPQQLKEIGDFSEPTKDARFKRLEQRLLTNSFLDSIPHVMEELRIEDPAKYLYYSSVFLSLYDKHKAIEKDFLLKEKRMELEQQRLNIIQKKSGVNINISTPDNSPSDNLINDLFFQ